MPDLSFFNLGREFWIPALGAVLVTAYGSVIYALVISFLRRRNNVDVRLQKAILTGLDNEQVQGIDDLVNLYRGINNSSDDDVAYNAAISRALRRILVTLAIEPVSDQSSKDLRTKIKLMLSKIEADTPFVDLPAAERNLIIDIKGLIEAQELKAASQKINDLANLIEARQEAYEKLHMANRWSVPLAVIGLVLSLAFGIISLL